MWNSALIVLAAQFPCDGTSLMAGQVVSGYISQGIGST